MTLKQASLTSDDLMMHKDNTSAHNKSNESRIVLIKSFIEKLPVVRICYEISLGASIGLLMLLH